MTKSFSLSVLVPTLSLVAALVPIAAWQDFNPLGWQGVSALPAIFATIPITQIWRNFPFTFRYFPIIASGASAALWYAFLWFAALTQPPQISFPSAIARALSEVLYSAPPVLMVGIAAGVAALGLMISAAPAREEHD